MKVLWVLQTLSWEKKQATSQVQTSATNSSVIPKYQNAHDFWVLRPAGFGSSGSERPEVQCQKQFPADFLRLHRSNIRKTLVVGAIFVVEDVFFWRGWLVFWGFFLGWGPHKMETNKYRIQRRMFRNQCGRGIYPYVWYAMSPTFVVDWYSDWMSFFSAQGVLSNIDTLH